MRSISDGKALQLRIEWRRYRQELEKWEALSKDLRHGNLYVKKVKRRGGGYYEYLYLFCYVAGGHPYQKRVRPEEEAAVRLELMIGNFIHFRMKCLRYWLNKIKQELQQRDAEAASSNLASDEAALTCMAEARQKQFHLRATNPDYKITTSQGDRVRSRAEALLCELFTNMGLPYQYEQPYWLRDGSFLKPDFTCTQPDGRPLFLELCGMMGQPDYEAKLVQRKQIYTRNGLYEGRDVIYLYLHNAQQFNCQSVLLLIIQILLGLQPISSRNVD